MWKVAAEVGDSSGAICSALEMRPDLAVEVTSKLRELTSEAEVLIFATNTDGADVSEALHAGVRGYLLKSDGKDQLAAGFEAAIEHKQFLIEKVSRQLSALSPPEDHQKGTLLTKRAR